MPLRALAASGVSGPPSPSSGRTIPVAAFAACPSCRQAGAARGDRGGLAAAAATRENDYLRELLPGAGRVLDIAVRPAARRSARARPGHGARAGGIPRIVPRSAPRPNAIPGLFDALDQEVGGARDRIARMRPAATTGLVPLRQPA